MLRSAVNVLNPAEGWICYQVGVSPLHLSVHVNTVASPTSLLLQVLMLILS